MGEPYPGEPALSRDESRPGRSRRAGLVARFQGSAGPGMVGNWVRVWGTGSGNGHGDASQDVVESLFVGPKSRVAVPS